MARATFVWALRSTTNGHEYTRIMPPCSDVIYHVSPSAMRKQIPEGTKTYSSTGSAMIYHAEKDAHVSHRTSYMTYLRAVAHLSDIFARRKRRIERLLAGAMRSQHAALLPSLENTHCSRPLVCLPILGRSNNP